MNARTVQQIARTLCFSLTLLCAASTVQAQQWAQEMFTVKEHDFGIVPRGAKTEFVFKFTNKYESKLHVAGVKSSCGCTTPRIVNKGDLKTYQTGGIACEFNTRSFIGAKAANITVIFDKPSYAEVQLRVKGNIRSDIVTEPGEINFGDVDRGQERIQQVKVTYQGRNRWEIKDVRSENRNLGVSFPKPARMNGGLVEYFMQVRLKADAPVGDLNDQIVLVTSDPNYNLVAIPVRGRVLPPLDVTPPTPIGTVKKGEDWSGRIVLKAKEPFSVKDISCDDDRFSFTPTDGEKKLHIIQVKFAAEQTVGAFRHAVKIETTLASEGVAKTYLSGNVVE